MAPLTIGKVIANRETSAIVRCDSCSAGEWQVMVRLVPMTIRVERYKPVLPMQCGTDRGYYRHRDRQETACEPCLAAHARAEVERAVKERRDRGGLFL